MREDSRPGAGRTDPEPGFACVAILLGNQVLAVRSSRSDVVTSTMNHRGVRRKLRVVQKKGGSGYRERIAGATVSSFSGTYRAAALREPNRLFQAVALYWRSPESGDVWYTSRHFKNTICSFSAVSSLSATKRTAALQENYRWTWRFASDVNQ